MPLDRQKTPYIIDVTLTYTFSHNHHVNIGTASFRTHLIMINSDL